LERAEYERLAALDRRLWWFRGLHKQILGALAQTQTPGIGTVVLDAGCGTGSLLAALVERFPASDSIGLELDAVAGKVARSVSGRPVCIGSVNALPFAGTTLGAIVSADVLCHRAVDEAAALEQFRRCLVPGGVLVLNLPAYRWLLSEHDAAVHNVRRYTSAGVRRLLSGAGFTRIRVSYWNTVLFPLMVLQRKLRWNTSAPAASDVALLPLSVEALFSLIVRAEAAIVRLGIRLPYGGSVVATAVKP
jgi:SAM-dependent methyltransferase